MRCPVCGREMSTPVVEGVEVDLCPGCGGVWLDGGELEALTGHTLESCRELDCPKCGRRLAIRTIGAVEVDCCEGCGGTWLDHGELESIRRVPPSAGADPGRFAQFLSSVARQRNIEIAKEALAVESPSVLVLDNVFLMYSSGILISSVTRRASHKVDEDILGSMLTAIQDFVEHSFESSGDSTLRGIRFGEREIVFARSPHLISAFLVSGELPRHFHGNATRLLKRIERQYGDRLANWNGDLQELEGIGDVLTTIFDQGGKPAPGK